LIDWLKRMPDIEAFRKGLLDLLDSIAAGGTDIYGGFTEILCMWFDDYWGRKARELIDDGVINEGEYEILNRFSEKFRIAYPKGTRDLEQDMRKLQGDPTWMSVVRAAKQAKAELDALASS